MSGAAPLRTAARLPGPGILALGALGASWLVAALVWAVPAPFSIDDFIYWAMADAFGRDLSLFVVNVPGAEGPVAFRLALLVPSGDRLAAQYPGGWGILAAPALQLGGLRGILLLNTLASVLTLWVIRLAAIELFGDRVLATSAALIYGLGTFAADYAFAIWPHAAATLAVSAAMLGAARAWRRSRPAWALAAGLALGIGINLRVDVALALPPIALWLVATCERPFRSVLFAALGTVPGLAAAAAINWVKFGIPSPVSYGRSDGYVSLAHHAPLLAAAALCGVAGMALGFRRVRALASHPAAFVGAVLVLAAALAAIPAARAMAIRMGEGFWALVVNFQDLAHPTTGLVLREDGALTVFGILKKALLQSAPVLAIVPLSLRHLAPGRGPVPERAPTALCVLIVAAVILPFTPNSWHGGASNSMRYLLHALPPAAILVALALRDLRARAGGGAGSVLAACVLVAGAGLAWPMAEGVPPALILRVHLPGALAAGLAAGAIALLVVRGQARAAIARALGVFVAGAVATGCFLTYAVDLRDSQTVRRGSAAAAAATADLPADALLVSYGAGRLAMRLNRPPALTAQPDYLNPGIAPDLAATIVAAHAEGRPVYADGARLAAEMIALGLARSAEPDAILPWGTLYLMPPP